MGVEKIQRRCKQSEFFMFVRKQETVLKLQQGTYLLGIKNFSYEKDS